MKILKICFVSDTWFPIIGGGTQVVYYYSKLLATNYNYHIDIITRDLKSNFKIPFKLPKNVNVITFGKKTHWNDTIGRLIFIKDAFTYLLKNSYKYDLVHAFPVISALPCILSKAVSKTPLVYTFFTFSNSLIYSLVERILFWLPYDLLLTDNYPIYIKYKNERNIKYMPNGVDKDLFNNLKKFSRSNQILYVGRFHKQKGIDILLEIFRKLVKKDNNLKLVMVGYGSEIETIKNTIKNYKLVKNIIIKPPFYGKQLVSEYKKSLFLLLPSYYEGGGIVVLEAWMSKIPVIASKTGSLKYLVKNQINGFLVKVGDINNFTDKALQLLKNPKIRKIMGENGYKMVKQKYTWSIQVNNLNKEYLKLLK